MSVTPHIDRDPRMVAYNRKRQANIEHMYGMVGGETCRECGQFNTQYIGLAAYNDDYFGTTFKVVVKCPCGMSRIVTWRINY